MRQRTTFGAHLTGVILIALIASFAPVRSALPQSSPTFTQTKLTAADAAQYDYFGLSVALAGDTAIVGAYGKSDLAPNAGAAYVFIDGATSWAQQARLGTSDVLAGAYLGAAVATNGVQTAVGAPYASIGAPDAGAVYLFSNADWQRQAIITPNDPESVARFGNALAIGQNTLIVGAPLHDSYGRDAGAVYVFAFDGVAWVQRQKLIGADIVPGDRFGSALALNNGWLAVGAPLHRVTGSFSGVVYLLSLIALPGCSARSSSLAIQPPVITSVARWRFPASASSSERRCTTPTDLPAVRSMCSIAAVQPGSNARN